MLSVAYHYMWWHDDHGVFGRQSHSRIFRRAHFPDDDEPETEMEAQPRLVRAVKG